MITQNALRCLLVLAPFFVGSFSTLLAQSTKAELFGILRDPSGLPVGAANVELVNTGTEIKSSAETDTDGSYHFYALSAGSYKLSVAKQGFTTLQRDGIVLRVGD